MASSSAQLAHGSTPRAEPRFQLERRDQGRALELAFSGRLLFEDGEALWFELRGLLNKLKKRERIDIDMAQVEYLDGGAMALLAYFRSEVYRRGGRCEFMNASEAAKEIIHLYRGDSAVRRRPKPVAQSAIEQIGQASSNLVVEGQMMFAFIGQLLIATFGILRSPKSANMRDVMPTMERTGADAVPIVLLINFLVGMVMAFQASVQLKRFGAEILVADLIGISVTRELGPLMTAIVVCGRSGAAFAAELGSMKVNEEVDALRTMGMGPMRYLVFPRFTAMVLVMPLLSLFADALGLIGGQVVAVTSLDLSATAYWHEVQKAVSAWDIGSGLLKSALFGAAITLIACQQGLATDGGAEGVGRRTTSAVVSTLFALIMIDAIFTVFFRLVGK